MTQKHAEQYIEKAKELRAVAVFVTHWRSREELTRLAEVYEHLAAIADQTAADLPAEADAPPVSRDRHDR